MPAKVVAFRRVSRNIRPVEVGRRRLHRVRRDIRGAFRLRAFAATGGFAIRGAFRSSVLCRKSLQPVDHLYAERLC